MHEVGEVDEVEVAIVGVVNQVLNLLELDQLFGDFVGRQLELKKTHHLDQRIKLELRNPLRDLGVHIFDLLVMGSVIV